MNWEEYYKNQALLYYRYMQDTHQDVNRHTPAMRIYWFAEFRSKDMQEMKSKQKK